VEMSVVFPAGIGLLYTLLILVSLKLSAQRSTAVHLSSEVAEMNFALREGHTIVGVMDTKKAMRFYISNDLMDQYLRQLRKAESRLGNVNTA
jgi:hypothetical protein